MNEIVMIPIKQLEHHPENPRKDLGDLTELAESIRKNGVMQNLTVVMHDPMRVTYYVVIGNRRMEAAKMAGLSELPCVISEMDHRTQIATMLEENMQRADLTVFEQAQGFQMMMDLGYSAKDISEKTGFGETTVRRRIKMAEMDPKLLKKACEMKSDERQITMFDFDRLAQVNSIKERNALLKMIGDRDFGWNINRTLNRQKAQAVRKDALKALQAAGVKELQKDDRYSGKYSQDYQNRIRLYEWDPAKPLEIPKTAEDLFYYMDDDTVEFYTKNKPQKKEPPQKKTEAEKQQEARIASAWKIADRCTEEAAKSREEFAAGMKVAPSNAMRMLQWALVAAFAAMMDYETPTMTIKKKVGCETHTIPELINEVTGKLLEMPQKEWAGIILMMFEGDYRERGQKAPGYADGYKGEMPRHRENRKLDRCYEWLTEFGYQMSTEEVEMMAGTHQIFQKGAKA